MERKTENVLFIRHPASLIVLHLYSLNLSDEELADVLDSHSQFVRDDIKTALLYSNNNDLKNKFNRAFKISELRKIESFAEAVQKGTSDEFLSKLSLLDKSSLETQILLLGKHLSDIGISSEQAQQCLDILIASIKKDFELEVAKYGLNVDDLKIHYSDKKIIIPESLLTGDFNSSEEKPVEKVKK